LPCLSSFGIVNTDNVSISKFSTLISHNLIFKPRRIIENIVLKMQDNYTYSMYITCMRNAYIIHIYTAKLSRVGDYSTYSTTS
jgi:hypothetical protein